MPDQLNPQQLQAANELDGPVKIVAGAGTGKTRVLTQRYINLVTTKRAKPENILCVTFTNKASNVMLERVRAENISIPDRTHWVMTFHKFGARLLRQHMNLIYPNKKFNIVDVRDAAKIIDNIIKQNKIPTHQKGKTFLNAISRAKDDYKTPEQVTDLKVAEIYTHYQKYLESQGYFDFGDLLCKAIDLLETHPEILEKIQNQLKYIQVDEYQDTNYAQHRLIMLIGEKHKNVCVVGDPDQTIYTWRGAKIENLTEFEAQIGNVKTILLEQNYRSHQNILDVANNLIKHNIYREKKDLWSERKSGIEVIFEPVQDQALYLTECITEIIEDGEFNYKDICVLYRNNNMSGAIESQFLKSSIPYETRGIAFYQRFEIKDCIAYLKILDDPTNDIQLERIMNTPRRGLGKVGIDLIKNWANQNSVSLFEALQSINDNPDSINNLSNQARKGCQKLLTAIQETHAEYGTDLEKPEVFFAALSGLLEKIDYLKYLKELDEKEKEKDETANSGESSRLENVAALLEICKESDGLENFLEIVTLDTEKSEADSTSINRVGLMTIHRAKGLEYPIVFVTNMTDFLFPKNKDNPDELEEERRLAYVAFTRAEDMLVVTWPRYDKPSQFIQEARYYLL